MSRWLGPIAGIAAGLGLAALLSHFGLPEGFGSFLLIALAVFAGFFVLRMLLARRRPTSQPLAYAASGGADRASSGYSPVASTPQWGAPNRIEPVLGSSAPAETGKTFPPGFDTEGFTKHAMLQFVRLQNAHDAGDRKALAEVLTPEMAAEVLRDLDTSAARPATPSRSSMPRCSRLLPKATVTGRASVSPACYGRAMSRRRRRSMKYGT